MKPTSIISLIIAVLLTIVGLVTCFIAQNMAESSGEQLFADRSDGNATITETFDPGNLERISIVLSSGRVNIYGNCDDRNADHHSDVCKLEVINFGENDYVFKNTGSKAEFNETLALDRFKFWENGFSFKGMRYILNLEQLKAFLHKDEEETAEREKQINIYLTREVTAALTAENAENAEAETPAWKLNQVQIKATGAAGVDVTIQNININADYTVIANRVGLDIKDVTTNSTIKAIEGTGGTETRAKSADVFVENSILGYLSVDADEISFRSNGLAFQTTNDFENNLKLNADTGSDLRIGLMHSIADLNCEIRSTGRILVDNEDRSNPYTHVAGSGNPTVTVKVGDADVTLQADGSSGGIFGTDEGGG